VKNAISGNIYVGDDRPDDSEDEDIVVNSIDLTQDYLPQIGTSNVNIYVKDMPVKIDGKQQMKANRTRLKALSEKTIKALKSAKIPGLLFTVDNQAVLSEPSIKQHFVNIRISWNIQTD
jgi:ribosome-binding factor A